MAETLEGLQKTLELEVSTDKLRGIDAALDPGGIGTFIVRNVLNDDQIEHIQSEIFAPGSLVWHEDREPYVNNRGMLIIKTIPHLL